MPAHVAGDAGAIAWANGVDAAVAAKLDSTVASSTYARGRVNALRMRRKFSVPFDNAAALPAVLMDNGVAANPWTMVAGVITPPATEALWRVALARDVVLSNGIARVTALSPSSAKFGIALTRDAPNCYLACILNGSNYGVYTIENGVFSALLGFTPLTDLDTTFADPPAMTLEVERRGTTITFRINGRTLWSSTGATGYNSAGRVGILADPAQQPTYRDFSVVEYLDAPISPLLTKVHAAGSSITGGIGASGEAQKFRNVLAARLQTGYTGNPVTVSNGGVNGENTAGMLSHFAADLAANTPQVCIIEVSVNDAHMTDAFALTAAQTQANLRAMVALSRQANAVPVLWTCKPINVATITAVLGANDFTLISHTKIADANNIARKIAADEGVILADVSHAFNADSSPTYTGDGLHPNDSGHALIASTIFDAMTGQGLI